MAFTAFKVRKSQRQSTFFNKLPPEIRNRIYQILAQGSVAIGKSRTDVGQLGAYTDDDPESLNEEDHDQSWLRDYDDEWLYTSRKNEMFAATQSMILTCVSAWAELRPFATAELHAIMSFDNLPRYLDEIVLHAGIVPLARTMDVVATPRSILPIMFKKFGNLQCLDYGFIGRRALESSHVYTAGEIRARAAQLVEDPTELFRSKGPLRKWASRHKFHPEDTSSGCSITLTVLLYCWGFCVTNSIIFLKVDAMSQTILEQRILSRTEADMCRPSVPHAFSFGLVGSRLKNRGIIPIEQKIVEREFRPLPPLS